tara:strand:- start:389 stop:601 length:213 start_codon:yes stop_codon:yes gene_type:complete
MEDKMESKKPENKNEETEKCAVCAYEMEPEEVGGEKYDFRRKIMTKEKICHECNDHQNDEMADVICGYFE